MSEIKLQDPTAVDPADSGRSDSDGNTSEPSREMDSTILEGESGTTNEKPLSKETLRQVYDSAMEAAAEARGSALTAFDAMVSQASTVDSAKLEEFHGAFAALQQEHEAIVSAFEQTVTKLTDQISAFEVARDLGLDVTAQTDEATEAREKIIAKIEIGAKIKTKLGAGKEKLGARVKEKGEKAKAEKERVQKTDGFVKGIERSGLPFSVIQSVLDAQKPGFVEKVVLERVMSMSRPELYAKHDEYGPSLLAELRKVDTDAKSFQPPIDANFDAQLAKSTAAAESLRITAPETYRQMVSVINQKRADHLTEARNAFRVSQEASIKAQLVEKLGPQMTGELLRAALAETKTDGSPMISEATLAEAVAEKFKGLPDPLDWKMMMHLPPEITKLVVEKLQVSDILNTLGFNAGYSPKPIELTQAYQDRERQVALSLPEKIDKLPASVADAKTKIDQIQSQLKGDNVTDEQKSQFESEIKDLNENAYQEVLDTFFDCLRLKILPEAHFNTYADSANAKDAHTADAAARLYSRLKELLAQQEKPLTDVLKQQLDIRQQERDEVKQKIETSGVGALAQQQEMAKDKYARLSVLKQEIYEGNTALDAISKEKSDMINLKIREMSQFARDSNATTTDAIDQSLIALEAQKEKLSKEILAQVANEQPQIESLTEVSTRLAKIEMDFNTLESASRIPERPVNSDERTLDRYQQEEFTRTNKLLHQTEFSHTQTKERQTKLKDKLDVWSGGLQEALRRADEIIGDLKQKREALAIKQDEEQRQEAQAAAIKEAEGRAAAAEQARVQAEKAEREARKGALEQEKTEVAAALQGAEEENFDAQAEKGNLERLQRKYDDATQKFSFFNRRTEVTNTRNETVTVDKAQLEELQRGVAERMTQLDAKAISTKAEVDRLSGEVTKLEQQIKALS